MTRVTEGPLRSVAAPSDRRARRRLETIEEILDLAEQIMADEGVNGLTLSEIARRLGVQPPSLYKYFDSLTAVYDALFQRGMSAHLHAMTEAVDGIEPGLASLRAALEASGRWCLEHQPLAQLLFWRPVPRFEPSGGSMAPSEEMVGLQRRAIADAVATGQLGSGASSDESVFTVSIMIAGAIGQAMANEPELPWGQGRFSPLFSRLLDALPALYPPPS
jgi:AcrR family transcriptional regulator